MTMDTLPKVKIEDIKPRRKTRTTKKIPSVPSDFVITEPYINNLIQEIVSKPVKRRVRHLKVVDQDITSGESETVTSGYQDTILTPQQTEIDNHHYVLPVTEPVKEIIAPDAPLAVTTFEIPEIPFTEQKEPIATIETPEIASVVEIPKAIPEIKTEEKSLTKESTWKKAWVFFKKIFTEFAKPYPNK